MSFFIFFQEYLAKDPTERNESNTLIFTVNQGQEPSSFTCVFPAFNPYEVGGRVLTVS